MNELITAFDAGLAAWLPPLARIALWAIFSACFSMAIYVSVSPQRKLVAVKTAQKKARAKLIAHDGDFDGLRRLIIDDLSLSLRHIGLATPAFLLAMLPLVWLMLSLSRLAGEQSFSDFGPLWMRGFDFWYIAIAMIASLAIKISFRIA